MRMALGGSALEEGDGDAVAALALLAGAELVDGAVALAMAMGLKSRDRHQEAGPSKYETEGVIAL